MTERVVAESGVADKETPGRWGSAGR